MAEPRALYPFIALLLIACRGGAETPSRLPLTLRASVNGGAVRDVSPPLDPAGLHTVLQLPNVGDVAVVTVFEGTRQVLFSLQAGTCAGKIDVAPAGIAMQHKVTDVQWGFDCNMTVRSADGSTSVLQIFALPAG